MKSPDYFTIMESKIKYYARKYDPDDNYTLKDTSPVVSDDPPGKKSVRERVGSGFGYIFSFLF